MGSMFTVEIYWENVLKPSSQELQSTIFEITMQASSNNEDSKLFKS